MNGLEFAVFISLLSGAGVVWIRTKDRVTPPTYEAMAKALRNGTIAIIGGTAGLLCLPEFAPANVAIILTGLAYFALARYIAKRIPHEPPM